MSFAYPHLSVVALLAGALAQFVIGFLWYSPYLPTGKSWIAQMEIPADAKPGLEMIGFPIGSILAAWAVAMVYGWSGASGPMDGALAGLTVAAAVAAQAITSGVAHATRVPPMYAINLGYIVVSYAVTGALIGLLS